MAKKKTRKTSKPKRPGGSGSKSAGESSRAPAGLETVRDLLFGPELAGQEKEISRLDERVTRETKAMRSEFEKLLRLVDARVQKRFQELTRGLTHLEAALVESEERLINRLETVKSTAQKRLTRLSEDTSSRIKGLRTQLRSSTAKIRADFQAGDLKVWEELAAEIESIQADLTSRKSLSSVFRQLSQKIAAD